MMSRMSSNGVLVQPHRAPGNKSHPPRNTKRSREQLKHNIEQNAIREIPFHDRIREYQNEFDDTVIGKATPLATSHVLSGSSSSSSSSSSATRPAADLFWSTWVQSRDRCDMVAFLLQRSPEITLNKSELVPHHAVDLMDRYVFAARTWTPHLVFPCLFVSRKLHDENAFGGYVDLDDSYGSLLDELNHDDGTLSVSECEDLERTLLNTLEFRVFRNPLLIEFISWLGNAVSLSSFDLKKAQLLAESLFFCPDVAFHPCRPATALAIVFFACSEYSSLELCINLALQHTCLLENVPGILKHIHTFLEGRATSPVTRVAVTAENAGPPGTTTPPPAPTFVSVFKRVTSAKHSNSGGFKTYGATMARNLFDCSSMQSNSGGNSSSSTSTSTTAGPRDVSSTQGKLGAAGRTCRKKVRWSDFASQWGRMVQSQKEKLGWSPTAVSSATPSPGLEKKRQRISASTPFGASTDGASKSNAVITPSTVASSCSLALVSADHASRNVVGGLDGMNGGSHGHHEQIDFEMIQEQATTEDLLASTKQQEHRHGAGIFPHDTFKISESMQVSSTSSKKNRNRRYSCTHAQRLNFIADEDADSEDANSSCSRKMKTAKKRSEEKKKRLSFSDAVMHHKEQVQGDDDVHKNNLITQAKNPRADRRTAWDESQQSRSDVSSSFEIEDDTTTRKNTTNAAGGFFAGTTAGANTSSQGGDLHLHKVAQKQKSGENFDDQRDEFIIDEFLNAIK
ncbi:unnamed protein product [Amoebophrya sp. A120]|nr:unnamed protein product [Amoebophrya sp. A120]|eukprot:GSA120T00006426001.1